MTALTIFEQHTQSLLHLADQLATLLHCRDQLQEDFARIEAELDGFHNRWMGCPGSVEQLLDIDKQIERIDAKIIAAFEEIIAGRADD